VTQLTGSEGAFPPFDPTLAPSDPLALFGTWFDEAIDAGVPEPQAMTVATADATGAPSARVVMLARVRDGGWEFVTDARSRKARELVVNPRAAATFYWQGQGRQVRLSGPVVERSPEDRDADFRARSAHSRAAALADRPGEPLASMGELRAATAAALELATREPERALADWRLVAIVPLEVEFWQRDPGRAHTRLVYRRDAVASPWRRGLEWP